MVSREELYQLVWAEPMTKVSARFGVSGSYMARVCDALNVPRPGRGHWTKLELGKADPAPPLPAAKDGDPVVWPSEGMTVPKVRPLARKVRTAPASTPRSLPEVHPIVNGTKGLFLNSRPIALGSVIEQWSRVMEVERFFADAERRASDLAEGERAVVLERLALARTLLGSQDPLDFLRQWRAPGELYRSPYP
jgi:hypothetical protein